MSQLQEMCATTQLPAANAVTWLNGLGSRLSLMPAPAALDWSWVISCSIQVVPVAYGRVKESAWPCLMPAPHLVGSVQVVVPPATTVQPLLESSCFALVGLYGHGSPCLPVGDRYLTPLSGSVPTGPTVARPYPLSGPLITAA